MHDFTFPSKLFLKLLSGRSEEIGDKFYKNANEGKIFDEFLLIKFFHNTKDTYLNSSLNLEVKTLASLDDSKNDIILTYIPHEKDIIIKLINSEEIIVFQNMKDKLPPEIEQERKDIQEEVKNAIIASNEMAYVNLTDEEWKEETKYFKNNCCLDDLVYWWKN